MHELFPHSPNKGEQARRRLLLAALERFGEKGYDNASVRDIAEEAGQNVGAIAYYFGNKETLYQEVLEGVGAYLRSLFADTAESLREKLDQGSLDPETALAALKELFREFLGEQLDGEFEKIRLVMMREQSSPSASFPVLYEGTLRPLHQLLAKTLAIAIGRSPEEPETIVRTHALFGQVLVFTLARETILRRLGVEKLGPDHVAMIGTIVDEHIELICRGLPPSSP